MAYQRKTEKVMTPPAKIETAADRGLALRVWLNVQDINVRDFADRSDLGRATIHRYIKGSKDLADIAAEHADKLLCAMGISDEEAWEILGIPPEKRRTFRSMRPWPLGSGASDIEAKTDLQLQLKEPLFGSLALPPGAILWIKRGDASLPHQVYELADGRLFSVEKTSGVQPAGTLLGGLSSVHFSAAEQ